jgi:hypothetical protein
MAKTLYVLSGSGIKDTREWTPSANEALRMIRELMQLRRPGARVEDQRGSPESLFELKQTAERGSGTKRRRSIGPAPR